MICFILLLFVVPIVLAKIDVNVMLPLNVIGSSMTIDNVDNLKSHLNMLKSAGVNGVMSDCWFGLVEKVSLPL
jgi:hypothetical protein